MTKSAIAPRWAGWIAALFGAEYAVGKVVMAVRGELGVPFHPAPPEAYEGFTGDVAVAQLGNAGLGVACVVVALALIRPWGRRLPTGVLAAGAVAALASGLAGAVVVLTSLLGVREDHGQWGIDSLLLGVLPLPAWGVLATAAVRASRVPSLVRALLLPGRRAAALAGAACVAYGAMKLSWALGGEVLMRQTPLGEEALRDMLAREPASVASHWASVALALAGVAVAVATVRAARLPRLVIFWLPAAIGALMVARASWGAGSDLAVLAGQLDGSAYTARWDLLLWSPFFGAWGAAWLRAALHVRDPGGLIRPSGSSRDVRVQRCEKAH
jgi:Protein of unknown function (DUF3995)